jgi:hypothetical protein
MHFSHSHVSSWCVALATLAVLAVVVDGELRVSAPELEKPSVRPPSEHAMTEFLPQVSASDIPLPQKVVPSAAAWVDKCPAEIMSSSSTLPSEHGQLLSDSGGCDARDSDLLMQHKSFAEQRSVSDAGIKAEERVRWILGPWQQQGAITLNSLSCRETLCEMALTLHDPELLEQVQTALAGDAESTRDALPYSENIALTSTPSGLVWLGYMTVAY